MDVVVPLSIVYLCYSNVESFLSQIALLSL